ncbi:uncharacterized protein LOC119689742 [Teleopsis dalmanni]|uniref:uncharacterized protein LOC119664015 n=1 Tax=Teleopsis dalmanni TaxID=139649 RepID=UPI0018CC9770|nr:uncharacterized protein LOC119664015 [Teleopsis dalmanni]XP_037931156.1 uncharacterized protein LOC119665969 [Teleopsis dalmanni]XP_037960567.1 uncharacterized protein LOC119689742 [Teleopsis dalmanni]
MNYLTSAMLLVLAISSCSGYSFLIPAKISHPGICIFNGLFLQRGDNSLPSSCQNMRCNEDGSILVQGCGHFETTDCRVVDPINLHKPYPDCCKMNFMCTGTSGQVVNLQVSPLERHLY